MSDAVGTDAPAWLSQADFAAAQGWSKSYVTKLKLQGRLVMSDAGKLVDVAASLARIRDTTERPERASAPAVSPSTRTDRDRQAFYDAEKSRLDLEERTGKLLQADDVLGALADAAVTFRSAVEAWPERLAPPIAALGGDEARIRTFLADHVEQVFHELSQRFAAMAQRAPA